MQNWHISSEEETYNIKIRGHLDIKWQDWFDGMSIKYTSRDETLLTGKLEDQAALHGILAKIQSLGLSLLSVNQVEQEEGQ